MGKKNFKNKQKKVESKNTSKEFFLLFHREF